MPVYFLRGDGDPVASSYVKIGYSGQPDLRADYLAICLPFPVRIVRTVDGKQSLEGTFHKFYESRRRHGEWFEWVDSMMTDLPTEHPAGPEVALLGKLIDIHGTTKTYMLLAKKLKLSSRTVRRWLRNGHVPWVHVPMIEKCVQNPDYLVTRR